MLVKLQVDRIKRGVAWAVTILRGHFMRAKLFLRASKRAVNFRMTVYRFREGKCISIIRSSLVLAARWSWRIVSMFFKNPEIMSFLLFL